MPESSYPVANNPPLPTGTPPTAIIPPPPVDDPSLPARASPSLLPKVGVKRGRETAEEGLVELPHATRLHTEAKSTEDRSNVASDSQAVPDIEKSEDQAAGLGSEGADRSAKNADPSSPVGEETDPPLVVGDGFAHALEEGNEHGFYFAYNGTVPFLNHKEASAGFQRAVYAAYHGEGSPAELVLAEEIAQLARLEQRVAFKRTHLSFTCETLLAEEKSSTKVRLDVVEKERDAALAKVKELEVDLASGRKENRSRKLKEQLEKAESENADLKKKIQKVESEKGDLKKALEVEVESSRVRDLALQSSREAEEAGAREHADLRADYDQLSEVGALEVKCLRERLIMVKERFNDLRAASEVRLCKLKAYLDEREFTKEKYLLFNQMREVFGTIERLKTQFAIDTPPIFYRRCREKEGKLESWLAERPQLSYEASDFELPVELEIDSLLGFLEEEKGDDAEGTRNEAANDRAEDEVAENANLAEEDEAAGLDE
ncbi:unnamed protein product [Cochlearia groenlandica]